MRAHLRPAVVMILLFTLITGIAYPLLVTGVAGVLLPFQAEGSLVRGAGGRVIGSALIAQGFAAPGDLHPRGSAAGTGWDATASGGTNLGPMDPKLIARVAADAAALAKTNPGVSIPADAVTYSGSGLDPDITPANAAFQAPRIAAARGLPLAEVRAVIAAHTTGPLLGFIGQPTVNVLAVNRALDTGAATGRSRALETGGG
jgi:K+-transporting ATPase ATPase C chain